MTKSRMSKGLLHLELTWQSMRSQACGRGGRAPQRAKHTLDPPSMRICRLVIATPTRSSSQRYSIVRGRVHLIGYGLLGWVLGSRPSDLGASHNCGKGRGPSSNPKWTLGAMTSKMASQSKRGLDLARLSVKRSGPAFSNLVRQAAASKLTATRGPRCGLAPGRGRRQGQQGGLAKSGVCGGVVLECSDLLALCVAPRDCGNRPAACPRRRDIIPPNATQLPLATAPDWDVHVRCPCGASLLSLIQRHGFNRANKAYACGSRPPTCLGSIHGGINVDG